MGECISYPPVLGLGINGGNLPSGPGWNGRTATTASAGSAPYRCGNSIDAGSPGTPRSQRSGAASAARSTNSITRSERPAKNLFAGRWTCSCVDRWTKPASRSDSGRISPIGRASSHSRCPQRWMSSSGSWYPWSTLHSLHEDPLLQHLGSETRHIVVTREQGSPAERLRQ